MKQERKKIIIMDWNDDTKKYLMFAEEDGAFLYDFWDCRSVRCVFHGLSKKKKVRYELTMRRIGEVEE